VIDITLHQRAERQDNAEHIQAITPRSRDRWRMLIIFNRFGPAVAGIASANLPSDDLDRAENDYYRFLNYPGA
jgi:hypothetical protein